MRRTGGPTTAGKNRGRRLYDLRGIGDAPSSAVTWLAHRLARRPRLTAWDQGCIGETFAILEPARETPKSL